MLRLSDRCRPYVFALGCCLATLLTGCPGEVPVGPAKGQSRDIMIFVGRIEQDNARLRRQGLIDELLGRSYDPSRFDEPGQVLKGEEFTILGTRTDGFDFGKAKALAEDAISAHPNLGCMVGLFAYNPPNILEALRSAGKLGEVEVVAFDEADETLEAIKDGHCFGTVVQDPYRYGYESVRILAGLARGDESVLPEGGFLDIPARKITKANVAEFSEQLKSLLEGQTASNGAASEGESNADAGRDGERPTVAFVTNGIASFWVIAEAGARAAGKDFDVNVLVRMPPDGVADQKRMLEELLTLGVDGIAVSPVDSANQTDILNLCAAQTKLITHDSDAPQSNRICYVGMSNYDAGRLCGELVREALLGAPSTPAVASREQ